MSKEQEAEECALVWQYFSVVRVRRFRGTRLRDGIGVPFPKCTSEAPSVCSWSSLSTVQVAKQRAFAHLYETEKQSTCTRNEICNF